MMESDSVRSARDVTCDRVIQQQFLSTQQNGDCHFINETGCYTDDSWLSIQIKPLI